MLNENVANIARGKYGKKRYIEMIVKKREQKQIEKKSGKELVNDVIAKTGIKLVKSSGGKSI